MSEAIIIYRGRGGSVDPELLKPTTITSNGNYVAPVTGNYVVYAVGGGGGGGGGCRNSWNSSQTYYGAGGSRGVLTTKTIFLNQGDTVPITLGAGGSGGTNNTTVVSNNSRGTNGSAGGTTSFGSYASSAGGTYGQWSWHCHVWNNQYTSSEVSRMYTNIYGLEFVNLQSEGYTHVWWNWVGMSQWNILYVGNPSTYHLLEAAGGFRYSPSIGTTNNFGIGKVNFPKLFSGCPTTMQNHLGKNNFNEMVGWDRTYNMILSRWIINNGYNRNYRVAFCDPSNESSMRTRMNLINAGYYTSFSWHGMGAFLYQDNPARVNIPVLVESWNNRIVNTATRCYTSIQSGTWWYTNNNTVSTSGTRSYRGDGGSSGQAGNAGFILVIPPTT